MKKAIKFTVLAGIIAFITSFMVNNVIGFGATVSEPIKIKIENKELTNKQYALLKSDLIIKYETKGYFTPNEWQTYVAVLDWEAKTGKLADIKNITKQNIISKINEAIK